MLRSPRSSGDRRKLEPPSPGPRDAEAITIQAFTGAAPVPPPWLAIGPGDDAAVFDGMAVTVDALCEGVHWDARLSAADVGYKAVAVSVSDLAAMGAEARWMVLAYTQPVADDAWTHGCARGVAEAASRWGVTLVGGDVTRSASRTVAITMGGPCADPLTRAGGRPGHQIWVTGDLGLAGAGYRLADPPAAALDALRRPNPPAAFARAARPLCSAGMDLSDGLQTDLKRLCAASGAGAFVQAEALPAHPSLAHHPDLLSLQVAAGDDYQLLLTAPPESAEELRALAAEHGVRLTAIGVLTDPPHVTLVGAEWPGGTFAHWEAT